VELLVLLLTGVLIIGTCLLHRLCAALEPKP
jgi:hypothetical protein